MRSVVNTAYNAYNNPPYRSPFFTTLVDDWNGFKYSYGAMAIMILDFLVLSAWTFQIEKSRGAADNLAKHDMEFRE